MAFQFSIAQTIVPLPKFRDAIAAINLNSGLKLCLDAGDIASVASGSQTKWLDTSSGGYDFFRGADGTATTDDPTFNGTPGALTSGEYWSFDGGDFFRYDTTNETWMNNLHKSGAKFTFVFWLWLGSVGTLQLLFGTNGGPGSLAGIYLAISTGGFPVIRIGNGTTSTTTATTTGILPTSSWQCVAFSVDLSAGTGGQSINGSGSLSAAQTYVTPSASAANATAEIASAGNGNGKMPSGTRIASLCAWEGVALSDAQFDSFFEYTRGRFGV